MHIRRNQSLKRYNTFHVDAKAHSFAEVRSVRDIQKLLSDPAARGMRKLVLGGGSNILLTRDFDGLVIRNRVLGLRVTDEAETEVTVRAGAGVGWNELVEWTVRRNYAGLENLVLIPGLVGAAPVQNIGAYGVEMKDTCFGVEAVDLATGEVKQLGPADCRFGYRDSVFKNEWKGRYLITAVSFRLTKLSFPKMIYRFSIDYGDVRAMLEAMRVRTLSLGAVSDAISRIRRSKLPDPKKLGNAGSFFKNPCIPRERFEVLSSIYMKMPRFPQEDGTVKVPAGWLVEQCGWKGKTAGRAGVYQHQALVLINHGGAKGAEILELAENIRRSVREKFGIELSFEVNIF